MPVFAFSLVTFDLPISCTISPIYLTISLLLLGLLERK